MSKDLLNLATYCKIQEMDSLPKRNKSNIYPILSTDTIMSAQFGSHHQEDTDTDHGEEDHDPAVNVEYPRYVVPWQ